MKTQKQALKNMPFVQLFLKIFLTILVLFALSKVFALISFDPVDRFDINYFYIDLQSVKYAGIALLFVFAAFYYFDKRLSKGKYLLFLIPLAVLMSGKALALVSVIVFLSAGSAVGSAFMSYFRPSKSIYKINVQNTILSAFIGICINSYIVWAAMHFRVNMQSVYYLFFLGEIFVFRKYLAPVVNGAYEKYKGFNLSAGQKAVLISAIMTIVYSLVPHYGYDSLIRHLYIPHFIDLNGYFAFDPHFVMSLDQAIVPQSTYVSVFLMGGEYAVRIINYLLIFIAFILLEEFTREKYGEVPALLVTLAGISTPFILWLIGVVFIDSFSYLSSAVLFIFLFSFIENPNKKNLIIFFLLASFSFICKQHAVYVIIPAAIIVAFTTIKKALRSGDRSLILFLFTGPIISLILISPFLVQNFILTGNPVFPYYNGIFKSEWFFPQNFKDMRYQLPLNWGSLYDITFKGQKYIENMNISFGISYFVFLIFSPLIFIYKKYRRDIAITFFVFVVYILLWFNITGPLIRYFTACLPMGSLIIGLTISVILDFTRGSKGNNSLIKGLIAAVFLANFLCQLRIYNVAYPYPLIEAFTNNYERSNLNNYQGVKKLFDYACLKHGKTSKCLLINSPYMYFADFKIETLITASWYHYKDQLEILSGAKGPADLYDRIFNKKQFDFIIMTDKIPKGDMIMTDKIYKSDLSVFGSPAFRNLLIREYSSGNYGLYFPLAFLDLCEQFNGAKITGRKTASDNAWKSTVAKIEVDGKACLFSCPDSSISYMTALPKGKNLVFRSSVGYHPAAKNIGGSDGVRMKVEISSGSISKLVFDKYVMPNDELFNVVVPLSDYSGKKITLKLYSLNDAGKNANGDWAVWFEPRII